MRLLPRYWHKVESLEELVKEGRLHLPDILLSNALRSIIQCSINEGYVTGFDFKFIEEYLLKSSDEPTTGASAHSTRLHSLQPSQCPSCSRSRHP